MQITALEGVGAEITGVDIKSWSPSEYRSIKSAFIEHGVIFLRDQNTVERDHIAFAKLFGEITINRFLTAHPTFPEIALVVKEPDQRTNIGGGWHTDHSYDHRPALGSVLVARELPESGGDTIFASMYKAYESLPIHLKKRIHGRKALHSSKKFFKEGVDASGNSNDASTYGNDTTLIGSKPDAKQHADTEHPMVISHPLSGKKALYVNPAFTVKVIGVSEDESRELLATLYRHVSTGRAFHHRFKWERGSIAMWDNRSTWHWALNDYHGQRRVMHRITIEGSELVS
jgi:taurine dioxygenase